MADFSTPFGSASGRRLPTADEKVNGFPCGPADQTLFNGLFHRIEEELGNVISAAGLTPANGNNAQVAAAIQALIEAATGTGDTESYLLMTQARARLPIFPIISTGDNRIICSSPGVGTVRIPGGVTFLHRGIFPITTVETDFGTDPSKTYHIRWSTGGGYALKDLANVGYNPSAASETSAAFDSTYDDMLIARVVTNASNVATITNLANKDRILDQVSSSGAAVKYTLGAGNDAVRYTSAFVLNLARTPIVHASGVVFSDGGGTVEGFLNNTAVTIRTRYGITCQVEGDWLYSLVGGVSGNVIATIMA